MLGSVGACTHRSEDGRQCLHMPRVGSIERDAAADELQQGISTRTCRTDEGTDVFVTECVDRPNDTIEKFFTASEVIRDNTAADSGAFGDADERGFLHPSVRDDVDGAFDQLRAPSVLNERGLSTGSLGRGHVPDISTYDTFFPYLSEMRCGRTVTQVSLLRRALSASSIDQLFSTNPAREKEFT